MSEAGAIVAGTERADAGWAAGATGGARGTAHASPALAAAIVGAGHVTAAELETPAVTALLAGARLRNVSLESRLALAAARLALLDAGLATDLLDADALGVVVATSHAGLQDYVELYRDGIEGERPRVRPAQGPQTGLNGPAAELSIRLPAAGPNATVCNGAVGGLDALRWAADQLAAGRAGALLVCGVEVVPDVLGGDASRGAAAVVVLEAIRAAHARGATPRALVGEVTTAYEPSGETPSVDPLAPAPRHMHAHPPAGSDAVLTRVADAAATLARREAGDPLRVRASDGEASGAVVLHAIASEVA
jgi:3-oxoacyl-(acyl-carrier-protein) synthase